MKELTRVLGGALLGVTLACGSGEEAMEQDLDARARSLARELLIADTHIDVPYRLEEHMEDVSTRTAQGDFDYPRARSGGLDLAFMSIYVPAAHQQTGDAGEVADRLIDMMETLAREHPQKFALVTSVAGARQRFEEGRLGLALGLENGAPVQGRLANLKRLHERGIRYITLAHSKSNHICDSSYDEERQWNGLSPFGREVVAEMNRLGIMIDVSHITDEAFDQVLDLSRAPVIASHSSCRQFTPGWERNLSDDMIRRLAENGGVIQINFGSSFLNDGYRRGREAARKEVEEQLQVEGIPPDSGPAHQGLEAYLKEHPLRRAELSEVVDHMDHVVRLAGLDHVGLGSDFDGVGDSLPTDLADVSAYPNLIRALLERGYSEQDVAQICSGNLLRVWSEVERIATELQASGS